MNSKWSILDQLADCEAVELVGVGELELEELEEGEWEPGTPEGPARAHFVLRYDPTHEPDPHTWAIKAELVALDKPAEKLLRWTSGSAPRPLPRYSLTGAIKTDNGEFPVRLESVTFTSALSFGIYKTEESFRQYIRAVELLAKMDGVIEDTESEEHMTEEEMHHTFSNWLESSEIAPLREAIVRKVIVGPNVATGQLSRCKMLVPNFVGHCRFEGEGIEFSLSRVSAEATLRLGDPDSFGKVLPGSYLEIEKTEEATDEGMKRAVEDIGWLLSFYAGRRVHPVAWEGASEEDTMWCIEARQITPLGTVRTGSCLEEVELDHFLQSAWGAWQMRAHGDKDRGEELRRSLRGVSNLYADILATTFPTQKVALTAMFLERFRVSVYGNSSITEVINQIEKKIDENEIATIVKTTLVNYIDESKKLTPEERTQLKEPIGRFGGMSARGLFRKSFKNSVVELYENFGLEIDKSKLQLFINERNSVIHGYWDSGREGTVETDRQARYGLNLLEKLILRLLEYEGRYLNRTNNQLEHFRGRA